MQLFLLFVLVFSFIFVWFQDALQQAKLLSVMESGESIEFWLQQEKDLNKREVVNELLSRYKRNSKGVSYSPVGWIVCELNVNWIVELFVNWIVPLFHCSIVPLLNCSIDNQITSRLTKITQFYPTFTFTNARRRRQSYTLLSYSTKPERPTPWKYSASRTCPIIHLCILSTHLLTLGMKWQVHSLY